MIYCAHAYWDKRNIFALCKAFRPSQSSIQKGKDLLHKVVMMLLGHHFFFLSNLSLAWWWWESACALSATSEQNKRFMLCSKNFFLQFFSSEACEADVVSLLLFPWKHFSCQDSIIFWPQLDYSQIIYHLSYIVNRQIPSGTSETLLLYWWSCKNDSNVADGSNNEPSRKSGNVNRNSWPSKWKRFFCNRWWLEGLSSTYVCQKYAL